MDGIALSGVLAALTDETIQLFVPERCGQIKDVWIDLGGFTVGVLVCLLVRLPPVERTPETIDAI